MRRYEIGLDQDEMHIASGEDVQIISTEEPVLAVVVPDGRGDDRLVFAAPMRVVRWIREISETD